MHGAAPFFVSFYAGSGKARQGSHAQGLMRYWILQGLSAGYSGAGGFFVKDRACYKKAALARAGYCFLEEQD